MMAKMSDKISDVEKRWNSISNLVSPIKIALQNAIDADAKKLAAQINPVAPVIPVSAPVIPVSAPVAPINVNTAPVISTAPIVAEATNAAPIVPINVNTAPVISTAPIVAANGPIQPVA